MAKNKVTFYDWYANFDYDLPLYQKIFTGRQGHILELAAGTGRLAIPLAKAGLHLLALDLSTEMLAIAREKTPSSLTNISFLCADMTQFELSTHITGAFIAANSFLLLPSLTRQRMCLHNIACYLEKDGLLAIDIFHPPIFLDSPGFQGQLTLLAVHSSPEGEDMLNHWFSGHYDHATQVVVGHNILEVCSPAGEVKKYPYTEVLRYLHRFEMELLLEQYGFEVVEVYGWYDGSPFISSSRRMIFIARKIR